MIGDVPQLAPTIAETTKELVKKDKLLSKKKVDPWVWNAFINPARQDRLKLSHWTKEEERDEIYPFARFNRKVEVVRYTDEEYQKAVIENEDAFKDQRITSLLESNMGQCHTQ